MDDDLYIDSIFDKINSEDDDLRSNLRRKRIKLILLRVFFFIVLIFLILLGVDYSCKPIEKTEIVSEKYYQVIEDLDKTNYHFATNSYDFLSDIVFYENNSIGDQVTYEITPIFKIVRCVIGSKGVCFPKNVKKIRKGQQ